jgi:uncharacterized membrane protein YGL010W
VAKKSSNRIKTPPPAKPEGVEFYFAKYAAAHQDPVNRRIQIICIPLLLFSLMGFLWVLPFPYIKFLGVYNADFNWSSFFIAISIYYYLRLSPILSYFMLFAELVFCFIITELVQWQKSGGPELWLISGVLFVVCVILLSVGYNKERKKLSFEYRYKNLMIAPLFLLHLVLKRFKIKY